MLVYSYTHVFPLIIVVITIAKISMVVLIRQEIHKHGMPDSTSYSSFFLETSLELLRVTLLAAYLGDNYPREWMSHNGPPVSAFITPPDARHYGIAEPEADDEWSALTPNNGIIYLGVEKRPFSLSMFHQIRCLDIIRKSIRDRASKGPSELDDHCLNYLRQMVLCRSGIEFDLASGPNGKQTIYSMRTCNNWNAVYSKVRDNLDQVASRKR